MGAMVASHAVGDLLTFPKHIFTAVSLNEREIASKNKKIKKLQNGVRIDSSFFV